MSFYSYDGFSDVPYFALREKNFKIGKTLL